MAQGPAIPQRKVQVTSDVMVITIIKGRILVKTSSMGGSFSLSSPCLIEQKAFEAARDKVKKEMGMEIIWQ